jgi:hypothetical protein
MAKKESKKEQKPADEPKDKEKKKLKKKRLRKELARLQIELVKLQEWIKAQGLKVVVIFEGRDAAGKGGRHQEHHPAPESPHLPRRGPGVADGTRENPMVFPALCGAPAGGRRDGVVRPQLV